MDPWRVELDDPAAGSDPLGELGRPRLEGGRFGARLDAVGSVLASTLGVIPGGLGVWEGISAALAVLVSLPASVGFLAAAILRVMGLIQNSLAAVGLALLRSRTQD